MRSPGSWLWGWAKLTLGVVILSFGIPALIGGGVWIIGGALSVLGGGSLGTFVTGMVMTTAGIVANLIGGGVVRSAARSAWDMHRLSERARNPMSNTVDQRPPAVHEPYRPPPAPVWSYELPPTPSYGAPSYNAPSYGAPSYGSPPPPPPRYEPQSLEGRSSLMPIYH